MKEGWKYMKLGEISESIKDGDWIEKKDQSLSGFRLIQTGNIGVGLFKNKAESARYISEETFSRLHCEEIFEGDILISRLPDPVGRACIVPYLDTRNITAVDCSIVKLNSKIINSDYFLLYTQSNKYFNQISSLCTGSTRQRITRKKLTELQIPVPPLSDQQRIVSYLDSEFAKIEALKANAEKQLQAAKDLFQTALKELMMSKEGWVEKKLVEEFSLKSGDYLPTKEQKEGTIPVYGGNGITGYHNLYNLSGEQILIGRVGALCGNIHYVNENIWVTDNAFVLTNISESWYKLFLVYELGYLNLNQFASQTAQPVISNKSMKDVIIAQPHLSEQQRIADRLDALSANVKALQSNYTETITLCNDLKQALLKKVFG